MSAAWCITITLLAIAVVVNEIVLTLRVNKLAREINKIWVDLSTRHPMLMTDLTHGLPVFFMGPQQ